MVKRAGDLLPGDKISFGEGPQLIIATYDLGDEISILLEGGWAEDILKDTQFYVFEDEKPKPKSKPPKSKPPKPKPRPIIISSSSDKVGPDGLYHYNYVADRMWSEKNGGKDFKR